VAYEEVPIIKAAALYVASHLEKSMLLPTSYVLSPSPIMPLDSTVELKILMLFMLNYSGN
jgi:hypothetical protein